MPCRQTYEVNKRELNKAAQRDQSYRNCLVALLIFFFLCLILILVCVPWKTRSRGGYYNDNYKHEYHHGERTNGSTTTTAKSTIMKEVNDVDIVSSNVSSRKDKGLGTNQGYIDGRTQDKATTTDEVTSVISLQITDIEATSTLPSEPVTTRESSSDEYFNTKESEFVTSTDNVASTSSTQSADLAKNTTTNSTGSNMILDIKDVTRDVTTSTLSTSHDQAVTTDMTSSDEYFNTKESEFVTSTDNVASTSSTQFADLARNTTTNSTGSNMILDIKDVTRDVTTSTLSTIPVTIDMSSSDEYFSTKESEFVMSTDNIATSPDLLEDETTVSTSEYVTSETYNITFSTLPTRLDNFERNSTGTREISKAGVATSTMNPSTDPKENTNTGYFSSDHSQKSQSVASIYGETTKPTITLLYSKKNEHMKYSTEKQEEESTTTGYDEILNNNDDIRRGTSLIAKSYTPFQSKDFSTTTEIINDSETIMNVTANTRSQNKTAERYNENVIPITEQSSTYNYYTYESASYTSTNPSKIMITSSISDNNTIAMTPLFDEEKDVCKSDCKRTASKMLSYMNHMVDPCDDFYEYACGGFEANPQLIDGDLVRQTKNYQRIAKQMSKEKREKVHSAFATYYDSCVHYERTVNFNEKVEMAIGALKDVGKFYTNDTWFNNYIDFTNLFIQLMLRHSALLIDIVPKFDEYPPTLQISLPKYKSPFMTEHADDLCFEDEFETEQQYVDLEALYANYKKCNKNTEEFLRSIKEALTVFSVFRDLNDSYSAWNLQSQSQYIEKTVQDINSTIMQGYFLHFPPKNEIQEIYAMNNYTKISLKDLQSKSMLVNWTQLISSLIGTDMMEANSILKNDLHIYLYEELMNGLSGLEKFAEKDPMSLNNAIMALYAHKLYRELVLSRRNDVKDHCLQVATNLLRLEASSLYISSFPDQEIRKMNKLIQNLFNDLKQTLMDKTKQMKWTDENGRSTLLKKISNLKLSLPDLSYYKDKDSLYSNYNMPQIMLDNDYFNNSMILLKRHRNLIYAVLRQTNQERQIWTHYATPFQSKAGVIYNLDVVIIPYGIMDWSWINEEYTSKLILLSTLGNLIAHQIAHYFDDNGLHVWRTNRNVTYNVVNDIAEHISCHKDNMYKAPMNFTLPLTEQTVSLTIPYLTLNERLSDIVGLRLAYDTLAYFTRSKAEKQLPWIKLSIEQLFYLAYVQMYCTKSPLTSSYVSLYESEDLPNRIRIFVSASNNKFVADVWNCPMGSQNAPSDICSVFPYMDYREALE